MRQYGPLTDQGVSICGCNLTRRLPQLESIHEFVKRANEYGSISRQEVVSMIPAFFLNIAPNHLVLDMCAAPGSKTFQLLEMMHSASSNNQTGDLPTGFVIANDVDMKRCNLLTHQTKRANSPCLLVRPTVSSDRFIMSYVPAHIHPLPGARCGITRPIRHFRYIAWVKCPYRVAVKASALGAGSDIPKLAY